MRNDKIVIYNQYNFIYIKIHVTLIFWLYLNIIWYVLKTFDDTYLAVIRDDNRNTDHLVVVISAVAYSFFPLMGYRPESQFYGRWSVLWKAHRCTFTHSRAHKIELYSDRYTAKSIERKNEDIVPTFFIHSDIHIAIFRLNIIIKRLK